MNTTTNHLFKAIRLEPLCPVHVGAGDTLSPLDYVMAQNDSSLMLHHIDFSTWIEDRQDKKELANQFANKTWQENRAFLARELEEPELYTLSVTEISHPDIFKRYQKEIADLRSEHQLLIAGAIRSPLSQALFIPGSSVKGAIRTAIIDYLDQALELNLKEKSAQDDRDKKRHNPAYNEALKTILGGITDNSFQALKVGDFPAALDDALLVEPKEVRRKVSDRASTPKNLCETTRNRIMAPDEVYELYGRMSLGRVQNGKPVLELHDRKISLDIEKLFSICTNFYRIRFEEERNKFFHLPQFKRTLKALQIIEEEIKSIRKDQTLLRIGHYSHVECMTVSENDPRTPSRKGKKMPFGTARTLANEVYPFGWVKLSICSEEEFKREEESRKLHDREVMTLRRERRKAVQHKMQESARQLAELQAEKERLEEAERQRQAELEAMPKEKRLLLQLSKDELNENQVVELYNLLDSLDEDLRIETAQALKDYWVKQGKWKVKPKQEKQYKKVCKIKSIITH